MSKRLAIVSTEQKVMAVWCNECRSLKGPNGERLVGGRPDRWPYRCGVDYGPDLHSHLDVLPLVAASDHGRNPPST